MPIVLEFKYLNATESQKKLALVYGRIFSLAAKRMIEKRKLQSTHKDTVDIESTQKYSNVMEVN